MKNYTFMKLNLANNKMQKFRILNASRYEVENWYEVNNLVTRLHDFNYSMYMQNSIITPIQHAQFKRHKQILFFHAIITSYH